MNKKIIKGLLMAAYLSPLAVQAEVSWTFLDSNCTSPVGCDGWDSSRIYEAATVSAPDITGPDVTVTSWYMNTVDDYTGGNPDDNSLKQGEIQDFGDSGLGAARSSPGDWDDNPLHAVGNRGINGQAWRGRDLEGVLFDFGSLIALTDLEIGWDDDSDLSILAGNTAIANRTYAQLVAGDWEEVARINNAAPSSSFNSGLDPTETRYWMVVAANSQLGPEVPNAWDFGDDAFKIKGLAGTAGSPPEIGVPEPGTLLMLGMGLPLLRLAARKKTGRPVA